MKWNSIELPDKPYYQDELITQYHSDALTILRGVDGDSIDLLCTDPPYGISFMGKHWDKALPSIDVWKECLRVLKPGSFAFVMSIPRADCLSRMIISLEDAGFRVDFSPIFWTYASGFPKAGNIGKMVDKRSEKNVALMERRFEFGRYIKQEREKVGITLQELNEKFGYVAGCCWWEDQNQSLNRLITWQDWERLKDIIQTLDNRYIDLIEDRPSKYIEAEREVISKQPMTIGIGGNSPRMGSEKVVDIPSTPQAKALDGSYGGFQPKPAVEVIIVAMKPLSEKTFVDQALKNGKGITWLDDCRVPYESEEVDFTDGNCIGKGKQGEVTPLFKPQGRFPANLLVSDDVLNDGKVRKVGRLLPGMGKGYHIDRGTSFGTGSNPLKEYGGDSGSFSRYFDLDKWAQKTFPFLIVPKASKSEKNKGCEELFWWNGELIAKELYDVLVIENKKLPREKQFRIAQANIHPTVKAVKLMSYLITLGSRQGDIVLDPFGGSGTTALASKQLQRKCITAEIEEKYCEIAANRCRQMVLDLMADKPKAE